MDFRPGRDHTGAPALRSVPAHLGDVARAAIADGAIASDAFDVTTGMRPVRFNAFAAVSGTALTLDASASAVDDAYTGMVILAPYVSMPEIRRIVSYVGATKVATIDRAYVTAPVATNNYVIYNSTPGLLVNNAITAAVVAADAGTEIGTAVWATAARTLTANTNLGLPFTVAGVVDANIQYVNDVAVTGVGTAGSPWGP